MNGSGKHTGYYDTTIMAVKSFTVQVPGVNVIKHIFLNSDDEENFRQV